MARTRSIKPGFFTNEVLGSLPYQDRLLFAGLWTIADKEGRLEDRPLRIRGELFPYDHEIDVEASLLRLEEQRFIHRYITGDPPLKCIEVCNFKKHQSPHHTEKNSVLPSPLINGYATVNIPPSTLITGLPNNLPPDKEPAMTPSLDEQFQKFKSLYEVVGNPIDEDFANGSFCWRAWLLLDYEQRSAVIASLEERRGAGVTVLHKPDNYITKNEWKRSIQKRKGIAVVDPVEVKKTQSAEEVKLRQRAEPWLTQNPGKTLIDFVDYELAQQFGTAGHQRGG